MKIDDIQLENVAKNNLWATLAKEGDALVFTDYRHPGEMRLTWEGDILWIAHSGGEEVGVHSTFPLTMLLDQWLPAVFRYFAEGGEKPVLPERVVAKREPPIADFPTDITEADNLPPVGDTRRRQVIEARVGQGVYRERLLAKWDNACAVTGLAAPALLVASHARPWKGGTNDERLDGDNGLPLVPNLDKLFDQGYVTFGDDGAIRLSPALPQEAWPALGVTPQLALRKALNPRQKGYMAYHRDNVFKGGGSWC